MCENLVVCFEGIDLIQDNITGIDGISLTPINAATFASSDSNEYEVRQNFNSIKQLTFTTDKPIKKTVEVNNSGIWILSTVFYAHPTHRH